MSTVTDDTRYAKLRRFNIVAAVVHAAQAVAVVLLANDFTLPMTATYMAGPPGTPPEDQVTIWNVPTAQRRCGNCDARRPRERSREG